METKNYLLPRLAARLKEGERGYYNAIELIREYAEAFFADDELTEAAFAVIDNAPAKDGHGRQDQVLGLLNRMWMAPSAEKFVSRILTSFDQYIERLAAADTDRAIAVIYSFAVRDADLAMRALRTPPTFNDLFDHALDALLRYKYKAPSAGKLGDHAHHMLFVAENSTPGTSRFDNALAIAIQSLPEITRADAFSALRLTTDILKLVQLESPLGTHILNLFDQVADRLAEQYAAAAQFIVDRGANAPAGSDYAEHVCAALRRTLQTREEKDGSGAIPGHHGAWHAADVKTPAGNETRMIAWNAFENLIHRYLVSDPEKSVPFLRNQWRGAESGSADEKLYRDMLVKDLPAISSQETLLAAKLAAEIWQQSPHDPDLRAKLTSSFDTFVDMASRIDLPSAIALAEEVAFWAPKDSEFGKDAATIAENLRRYGPKEHVDAGTIAALARGEEPVKPSMKSTGKSLFARLGFTSPAV